MHLIGLAAHVANPQTNYILHVTPRLPGAEGVRVSLRCRAAGLREGPVEAESNAGQGREKHQEEDDEVIWKDTRGKRASRAPPRLRFVG